MFNSTEPLGLPRGSVRAGLTFGLVAVLCVTLFVPVVPEAKSVLDGMLALAVMSVRDYFGSRETQVLQDGPVLPPPSSN